jgi:hypothetical protein
MAKLTLGQKAERLLKLLMGLNNRQARAALQAHGFRQEDLDEGWGLLERVALVRFDALSPSASPSVVEDVDAWENRWFAVIDATLRRSFPEVHARVMLNLSQTDGPPVLLSVQTLLQRLDALRAATDPTSQAAFAKLQLRGVTVAVLDEVRALLKGVTTLAPVSPSDISPELEQKQREANEQAMWDYYLEWSAIARSSIKDRPVLRLLGFAMPKRRVEEEDDDVADDLPPTQTAPVAPVITAPTRPAPVVPTA